MSNLDFDAWDRAYEAEHPEEFYCGFHLMPVVCIDLRTGARHPAIDVYDRIIGTLCNVATVEAAKGWVDGQMDIAGQLLDDFLDRRRDDD